MLTIEDRHYDLSEASRVLNAAHKVFFDLLSTNLEHGDIKGYKQYEYADTLLHLHDAGFIRLKKKDAARLRVEKKQERETLLRMMRRALVRPCPV